MLFKRDDYHGSPGVGRGYKHQQGKEGRKIHGGQGYGGGGGRNNNNNSNYNNNNNSSSSSGHQASHRQNYHQQYRGNYRGRNNFNRHHPYNSSRNSNYNNNNSYHQKEELPLLSRAPCPPAIYLLRETKKRFLTDRLLTPVQHVRTFDEWAECYFQDYHIRYNHEVKKWERTDSNEIVKEPKISPSGKLTAEYFEKYYEDYDSWCLQREHIANDRVGPISVPVSGKGNHSLFERALGLGLEHGRGYHFIRPLPSHFIKYEEEQAAEAERRSRRDSEDSAISPGGFIGEIDRRGTFFPSSALAESGGAVRYCYNKNDELIGIDGDDDLILRTPYADRFSRSDSLSPGAAKRPHWELGPDGKAHMTSPTFSEDKNHVTVALTRSKLSQFWKSVIRGKAKLPPQLRKTKIAPSLFVKYRIPYLVGSRNGNKKIFMPREDTEICSEEINGGYQFLKWAAKQEKIARNSTKVRFVVSPTSTESTSFSPSTPLTPGRKRQQQQQQQQQRAQQSLLTVAAPVPVPVPVPNIPFNTHLNGDAVKLYLGEYIGALNRAGPPELLERDLEIIFCHALRTISSSLPPSHNSTITYERLSHWFGPIAESIAQFKRYHSLKSVEEEARHKELDKKVAHWRKRFENKDSDDEA